MSILDRVALVVAERHSERVCVTASVDSMHFLAPARKGDILIFRAAINRSWKSSMEVGIRVSTEHYTTGQTAHILSAYFTFVAVDSSLRPVEVPQVIPETPIEKRRYEEAEMRRQPREAALPRLQGRPRAMQQQQAWPGARGQARALDPPAQASRQHGAGRGGVGVHPGLSTKVDKHRIKRC